MYYVKLETKVDAIVFTAGVGENAREFRDDVIRKLACLGVYLDEKRNMETASYLDITEGVISRDDSTIPVFVVPTNEELMIALDTFKLVTE